MRGFLALRAPGLMAARAAVLCAFLAAACSIQRSGTSASDRAGGAGGSDALAGEGGGDGTGGMTGMMGGHSQGPAGPGGGDPEGPGAGGQPQGGSPQGGAPAGGSTAGGATTEGVGGASATGGDGGYAGDTSAGGSGGIDQGGAAGDTSAPMGTGGGGSDPGVGGAGGDPAGGGGGGATAGSTGAGGCVLHQDPCDLDCDGHLRVGPECHGDDCCDADPNAFTGQTAFFTEPDFCQSFDYNCDGKPTGQYGKGESCHICGFNCCSSDGFIDDPPACGASGQKTGCSGGICGNTKDDMKQGCN